MDEQTPHISEFSPPAEAPAGTALCAPILSPAKPWTLGRVPIDRLILDPNHVRREMSSEGLDGLAASIRDRGLLAPLRVRWDSGRDCWVVVCGARRFKAARRAGLSAVPCLLVEGDPTEADVLVEQLIENLQREELDPVAQARGFRQLMELNGWTASEVAQRLHIHKGSVSRALSLLDLPSEVRDSVSAGKLPASVGYELSKLGDPQSQRDLAAQLVAQPQPRSAVIDLVRDTRQAAGEALTPPGVVPTAVPPLGPPPPPEPRGSSKTFVLESGAKVVVFGGPNMGLDEVVAALEEALDQARTRADQEEGRGVVPFPLTPRPLDPGSGRRSGGGF